MTKHTQTLTETVRSAPSRVDLEKGVIYGAVILGKTSKNGFIYSANARKDAAKLYEDMGIHVDHPQKGQKRSARDKVAWAANVKLGKESVLGDIHFFNPEGDFERRVLLAAKKSPRHFGLSHRAECGDNGKYQGDKLIVEGIINVESIDIVSRPATTDGLFEESVKEFSMQEEAVAQETEYDPLEDLLSCAGKLLISGDEAKAGFAEKVLKLARKLKGEGDEGEGDEGEGATSPSEPKPDKPLKSESISDELAAKLFTLGGRKPTPTRLNAVKNVQTISEALDLISEFQEDRPAKGPRSAPRGNGVPKDDGPPADRAERAKWIHSGHTESEN